jgi:hypothetical protein
MLSAFFTLAAVSPAEVLPDMRRRLTAAQEKQPGNDLGA